MNILLIKLGALGDVLRTTSVLHGIKEKYPGCSITWLTEKIAYDLLKNNDLIDKIVINNDKVKENIPKKINLVINLDEEESVCKLASEIRKDNPKTEIIGFYRDDEKEKIMPTPTAQGWYDMGALGDKPRNDELKAANKKTYQQIMFEIIGIKPKETRTILNLTDEEKEFGKEFAKKNAIEKDDFVIGINTGAGARWQHKSWRVDGTIELIDMINNDLGKETGKKVKLVLLGGPEEKERNKEIKDKVKTKIIDAGVDNSLMDFASIINICDMIVTSDSLAMHITLALGKKIVVFFGPTSGNEIEIYNLGKKVTSPIDCVTCYRKRCDKKPHCMDTITTQNLYDAVKGLIS